MAAVLCLLAIVGCSGDDEPTQHRGPSAPAGIALDGDGLNPPPKSAAAPPQPPAPANDQADAEPSPATDTSVEPVEDRFNLLRGTTSPSAKQKKEEQAELPTRPEDLDKWRPEDFLTAKAEGDAKLVEAIARLGERAKGSKKAATLYVQLLQVEKEEEEPEDKSGNRRGPARGRRTTRRKLPRNFVPTIIEALGKSGTSVARQTLMLVIIGGLETESNDRNLVPTAIEALVNDDNPEAQDLLFMILTATELPVKTEDEEGDDRRDNSAESNRETALDLLRNKHAHELRMRLADAAVDAVTPADQREAFLAFLTEPDPDNLPAQKKIYLDPSTQAAQQTELGAQFIEHSIKSIDELLGIPSEVGTPANRRGRGLTGRLGANFQRLQRRRRNRGAVTKEPDPNEAYWVAEQLWSPELVDSINEKLKAVEVIDEGGISLVLSWSLPVHSVRQKLYALLKEHWDEGTENLKSGGRFGEGIHDPGLILVVKSAPRKTDPAKIDKPKRDNSVLRSRSRRRRSSNKSSETSESEKARYEWMEASEDFLRVLNERFFAAAKARGNPDGSLRADSDEREQPRNFKTVALVQDAANTSDEEERPFGDPDTTTEEPAEGKPSKLPFRLHPSSEPMAEYHLNWPADIQDKISGVEVTPMIIHYVRIEETNRISAVRAFYNRQFSKFGREREIKDGHWFDVVEPGTKPDWRRSTDVLITQTEPDEDDEEKLRRRRTKGEPLIIEVLSIEIPDPRK